MSALKTEIANQVRTEMASRAAAARFTNEQITEANLETTQSLPSLDGATTHPAPLNVSYWSPAGEGEFKDVFIAGVGDAEIQDFDTKESKIVECVFLLEQTPDRHLLRWYSASAILVSTIKGAIERSEIIPGTYLTPCRIIYKGLKKTKTGRNAANWEILRLIVSVQ